MVIKTDLCNYTEHPGQMLAWDFSACTLIYSASQCNDYPRLRYRIYPGHGQKFVAKDAKATLENCMASNLAHHLVWSCMFAVA